MAKATKNNETKKNAQVKVEATKKATTKKTAPIEKSVKVNKSSETSTATKTTAKKKAETKKTTATAKKPVPKKAPEKVDVADVFAANMKFDGADYTKVEVKNWNDFVKLSEDETLFVAFPFAKDEMAWYSDEYDVPAPKKGFENGLDFLQVILVQSNNVNRFLAASIYTEAVMSFFKNELKVCKNGNMKLDEKEFAFYVEK